MGNIPNQSALILVDIQNDFMPTGSLPVPDGDHVVPIANQLTSRFSKVFATQDWHPANHGSFAATHGVEVGSMGELGGLPQVMWPTHCVQGTDGAEFVHTLDLSGVEIIQKGTDPNIDSYSGFFDNGHLKQTPMHERLQSEGINEVFIMGVATDYCVFFTALDAVELGYKTHLVADGCRGVDLNRGDVENAIEKMKEKGVEITASDRIYP